MCFSSALVGPFGKMENLRIIVLVWGKKTKQNSIIHIEELLEQMTAAAHVNDAFLNHNAYMDST